MKINAIAAVVAAALFTACAHAPAGKQSAACQSVPQWITTDANGQPVEAVFVCFSDDHRLLWSSRALTDAERAAAVQSKPLPKAALSAPARAPGARSGPAAPAATARPPLNVPAWSQAVTNPATSADPCADASGDAYTRCRIAQKASKAPGDGLKAAR